jgi:uncharacterized protein
VIYLDTAALVKLIRTEPLSATLVSWLGDRSDEALVASSLVEVELPRALRRSAPAGLAGVPSVLSRLYRLEIDATIRAIAANYDEAYLRSLDAIHLATAQVLASSPGAGAVTFVTYDRRLLAAAAQNGLAVASPGQG